MSDAVAKRRMCGDEDENATGGTRQRSERIIGRSEAISNSSRFEQWRIGVGRVGLVSLQDPKADATYLVDMLFTVHRRLIIRPVSLQWPARFGSIAVGDMKSLQGSRAGDT